MKKLALAVTVLAFSVGVNAACDIKSLKGNYIVKATYTGYKSDYPTTCGDIGLLIFDGKGGVIGVGYESCAGNTYELGKSIGSYNIDPYCSGEIAFESMRIKYILDRTMKNGVILGGNPSLKSSGIGTISKQ